MAQAVCSSLGCLTLPAVTALSAGVQLSFPGSSLWLLPGTYNDQTPSLSRMSTFNLSTYLANIGQATQQPGPAWGLYASSSSDALKVAPKDATFIGYRQSFYAGDAQIASATSKVIPDLRSVILNSGAFATVTVQGSDVGNFQVWDALPDSHELGFGNSSISLVGVYNATAVTSASTFCAKGSFRANDACQRCDSNCETCYGGSSSNCLSCWSNNVLSNGACKPAACANGLGLAPGLAACMERFVNTSSASQLDVSSPALIPASTPTMAPADKHEVSGIVIGAIVISSLAGAILLGTVIWRLWANRRRGPADAHRVGLPMQNAAASYGATNMQLGYVPQVWPVLAYPPPYAVPVVEKAAYPHFGALPDHDPYNIPGDVPSDDDQRPILRPLTYLGLAKPKKKRKRTPPKQREREQSGWLRRLTGAFNQHIPPVPRIPSTYFDGPTAAESNVKPATAGQTSRPEWDAVPPPPKASGANTGKPRPTKAKAKKRAAPVESVGKVVIPPQSSIAQPAWAKEWSIKAEEVGQRADAELPRRDERMEPAKKGVNAHDDLSERRRKVTTRLANWLADSSSPAHREEQLGGRSELNRISGMSDWETPRSERR